MIVDRLRSIWNKERFSYWLLPLAAFVVGAAVMAVEIAAARLLAPYFGASVIVWSSLILVVLLALSVGYWLGGKLAARSQGTGILAVLMIGAAATQAVGARLVGLTASSLTGTVAVWQDASWGLMVGSLLTAIVALALPMIALGSMSPQIIELWAERRDVAKASSGYLLMSTLGGAFGTLAPTLWLVPTLGTQRTIGLFTLVLFVCGLAFVPKGWRWGRILAIGLLLVSSFVVGDMNGSRQALASQETAYQLIRVLQGSEGRKALVFNEGSGIQSMSSRLGEPTGAYFDYFGIMPLLRPDWPVDQRVAIIGLAAGTSVNGYRLYDRQIEPRFVGVEIDPAVIEIGREHFGLDELPVETVVADGRIFLEHSVERYQAIIIDAYSVQLYIPSHLVSQEFFQLVYDRLTDDGLAAININVSSMDSRLFRTLTNTMASIFPYVEAIPQAGSWNWVVLMSRQPIGAGNLYDQLPSGYEEMGTDLLTSKTVAYRPDQPVFTDDWAPVEHMTESMVLSKAWEMLSK